MWNRQSGACRRSSRSTISISISVPSARCSTHDTMTALTRSTDEARLAEVLERVLDKGVVIADSTLVISNASRDRHLRREAIEHANIDAGPLADPADR